VFNHCSAHLKPRPFRRVRPPGGAIAQRELHIGDAVLQADGFRGGFQRQDLLKDGLIPNKTGKEKHQK